MTLPFDLDPAAAAFLAAAVFGSALVRGYCGFGFSALVIAAAALVTHRFILWLLLFYARL